MVVSQKVNKDQVQGNVKWLELIVLVCWTPSGNVRSQIVCSRCSSKICHTLLISTFLGCFIDHVDDKTSSVFMKVRKKLGVVERFISLEGIFTDFFFFALFL